MSTMLEPTTQAPVLPLVSTFPRLIDYPSYGGAVVRWIESNLVHGEGDYLGEPFRLEPWQRAIVWAIYSYDPVTLRRVVRRVLIVLPKGTGKTELVAAICLAELAGPTWLNPDTGRPARRRSPNIPIAAASYEQADRLYFAARTMVDEGPLAPFVETYDTEMLLRGDVGRAFRVAAVAGTNDGGLPSAFAADEVHEWTGRKERVHLVIGNSLAKRADGLELNLSTPDEANPSSLLGRLVDYGQRVASGEVDDPSFLYVHYGAPDPEGREVDIYDPEQLRAAIRACHPASWVDVDRVAARLEVDRIPEHEFRRYHLAQFVRAAASWLPAGKWQACARDQQHGVVSPPPPPGTPVILGFDGSYNNDSTALVGCTLPEDGEQPYLFVAGHWERPEGPMGDGWVVDREDVDATVHRSMMTWRVRHLVCDPPGWHNEIEAWGERYGMADDYSTVIRFETNRRSLMAHACSRFYSAVVNGQLEHDGNPALARHLHNAVLKETSDGAYITKDGRNSPRKIDLAVAAVVAYERATQATAPFLLT